MRPLQRRIPLVLAIVICAPVTVASGQGVPDNPTAVNQANQRMLIPAYKYPGEKGVRWTRMCQGIYKSLASAIIVMNDRSGSFTTPDDNYRHALRECTRRRTTVIGYVTTDDDGQRRALGAVKADVAQYYKWYPRIRGIFFDEMRNNPRKVGTRDAEPGEMQNKAYFRALYSYVKNKSRQHIVVGNPGAAASTEWQVKKTKSPTGKRTGPVVDILVTFEGPTARVEHADGVTGDPPKKVQGYNTFTSPKWTSKYKAKRFAHLVYRAANPATPSDRPTITSICRASATRHAGVVYVTSDNLILPDPERPNDLDPGPPILPEDMNQWDTFPEPEMIGCPTLHRREVISP